MGESDSYKKLRVYIKKNLSKRYTLESLKWALINQGYSRAIIEEAVKQVNLELAELAPILKEKPRIIHQIIDEYDNPIVVKKSFWKRIFGN